MNTHQQDMDVDKLKRHFYRDVQFPQPSKFGSKHRFHHSTQCPACTQPLHLLWIAQDLFPYQHTDICLHCLHCGTTYLFGYPADPLFGMELIIWDNHPAPVLQQALALTQEKRKTDEKGYVCPFHGQPFAVTKIWGDKVMKDPRKIRVQWKCPDCFLVVHETVDRIEIPPEIQAIPVKDMMRSRLHQLGYIDGMEV